MKNFKNNAFELLEERGFIKDITHKDELMDLLSKKKVTFYLGIDPTAETLHIGHFFALQMFKILQDCGHRGILVIGGSTAMVGDPSFKSDMRKMLSQNEVDANFEQIKNMLPNFINVTGDNPAIILNNKDWINDKGYVQFLRDVGTHFNISKMLACEAYKNRLSNGLTFLEIGYMLMQAFDFVHLNQEYGTVLQIGGTDQWANIIAGVDLSRKINIGNDETREQLIGLCCPLLTNANGIKMGKTEKGTLWVSSDKTTAFDFYQHFINCFDEDVERLLRFFTKINIEKIVKLCKEDIVSAKKLMAFEVTKLVHGEVKAKEVENSIKELFDGNNINSDSMPNKKILIKSKAFDINVIDLLSEADIFKSKGEIRRLIQQGGITINNIKIVDCEQNIKIDINEFIIKKGKKTFFKLIIEN